MAIFHQVRDAGRFLVGLVLLGFGAGPVRAENSLNKELAEVAKDIKTLLVERGEDSLSVGQFTGPPTFATSGGPGIAQVLIEELHKLGLKVKVRANVGVEGKYRDIRVKESGHLAVELTVNVVDRTGKALLKDERRIGIFHDAAIASLLGLTVDIPPVVKEKARKEKLEEALDKPQAYVNGARCAASPGSPYAIEILVGHKAEGAFTARKPVIEDGLAFVQIKRGEIYRVRLINKSEHEAAATLTIDGLNMFVFCKTRNVKGEKFSQVIVDPGKAAEIKGWPIDNEKSDAFLVTEYAKTAAAELKSTAKTGTITVSFAMAWPKNARAPADEPDKAGPRSAGGDGTGRGPRLADKYIEVERKIGVVRATVSVRYTK